MRELNGTVFAWKVVIMRHDRFTRFARWTSRTVGHTQAFVGSLAIVIVGAATGPYFHYSDTWQLVINTGTTVITFLRVFVIQQTQNRDSEAVHVKLDEIIDRVVAEKRTYAGAGRVVE